MNTQLIVISGPTACGKDVVTDELIRRFPVLTRVVTATTRPKRRDDREGVDYFFESRIQFERLIAGGELLEWALVHGNYYGLPKSSLQSIESANRVPVLIIDVQGAATIKKSFPDALSIFLYPDPLDAYLERLTSERGAEKNFEARLQSIHKELESSKTYDAVIINRERLLQDTIDEVVDTVAIYLHMKPLPAHPTPTAVPPVPQRTKDTIGR